MEARNKKKVLEGEVISNKMEKTVVVKISKKVIHPRYQKLVEQRKKYYAHDDTDAIEVGQRVKIMETRPLSKLKRWRVVEVVEGKKFEQKL